MRSCMFLLLVSIIVTGRTLAEAPSAKAFTQYPYLCGATVIEIVLDYFGINTIGPANYIVDEKSHGRAVAQFICDLVDSGEFMNNQPACIDKQGQAIPLYPDASPKATKQAFERGIDMFPMSVVLTRAGLHANYFHGVAGRDGYIEPPLLLKELTANIQAGKPVIVFTSSTRWLATRHYILLWGYDSATKQVKFIDPRPQEEPHRNGSVLLDTLISQRPLYDGGPLIGNRFIVVSKPPQK